jgi:hypothetical protein
VPSPVAGTESAPSPLIPRRRYHRPDRQCRDRWRGRRYPGSAQPPTSGGQAGGAVHRWGHHAQPTVEVSTFVMSERPVGTASEFLDASNNALVVAGGGGAAPLPVGQGTSNEGVYPPHGTAQAPSGSVMINTCAMSAPAFGSVPKAGAGGFGRSTAGDPSTDTHGTPGSNGDMVLTW